MEKTTEYKILFVDDDNHVLDGLKLLFEDSYQILIAASGPEAIDIFKSSDDIAVVVMDIKMPKMDGIETVHKLREIDPEVLIIFHTGFPGLYDEDKIDSNENPFDYVQKGGPISRLERAVKNAMKGYASKRQISQLLDQSNRMYNMVGNSLPMQKVYEIIRKVAPTNSKVMVLGETGTGKDLVARAIYQNSMRHNHRLVIFSCNHKSPDLVESELFGHGKGAFTGAVSESLGLFEYADGGTIFLDEIGDLDITTQAKVLRVLEAGEFQTVGKSTQLKKTDVRIICATHHDLEKLVEKNKFREDLYYRLKGVVINLPPLRERKEDIPNLIDVFADKFTIECDRLPKIFDQSALHELINYNWPGNVRQLRDTIEAIIVLNDSGIITANEVVTQLGIEEINTENSSAPNSLAERIQSFRRECIIEALHDKNNNVNAAARILQVDPSNLRKWIKNYNIISDS